MKILIDIGHPAHVHLFRNFAKLMHERGHTVRFTTRDKEFETRLLDYYQLQYVCLGRHYKTKPGKLWGLFRFTYKIFLFSRSYKPDIYLSHGSFYAAIVSWLSGKPHISFEDTYNFEQIRLYRPFTKCILTGNYPHPHLGRKQLEYASYHELAYLHPKYFQADPTVKKELGVSENEKYFILRFISWDASHDAGQNGLTRSQKKELVELLSRYGRVFISAERKSDPEFEKYRYSLPPERIHDTLAFADIFVGEGATMASECAVLGTPSVYINSMEAGSIDEQEKFGLLFHLRNGDNVLNKVREIIDKIENEGKNTKILKEMLAQKIDLTAFLVWFIENWPESRETLIKNPDYQLIFKQ